MYTVLVVDKKKQMFHIYKHMIHWEEYHFEVISYADNENDALAYYREYRHDLVISDTVLQHGSGLSLLKQLKEYSPNCHVILCSYDDHFDTIRQAWRMGCMDYLQKGSLKNSQLIENIEAITRSYETRYVGEITDWHQELQRILGLIRDHQPIQNEELYVLLKRSELNVLRNPYRILYFRMDDVKETFWKGEMKDRQLLCEQLREAIEHELAQTLPYVLLFSKMHAGMILINETDVEQLTVLSTSLIHSVKDTFDISISMVLSQVCKGYEMFYDTYIAYIQALSKRFYLGNGAFLQMEQLPQFHPLAQQPMTLREEILHDLDMGNEAGIQTRLFQLLEEARKRQIEPSELLHYATSIIKAIERSIAKKGLYHKELFETWDETVQRIETIDLLEEKLTSFFNALLPWMTSTASRQYTQMIIEIIQYIHVHIDEKITLQDIAKATNRTPIHISRVFKKQMNENLIYYVNECKMKKAVELMELQPERKLKEIAEDVGIVDQLYFNKVFRKYYHMSPREYRRKL